MHIVAVDTRLSGPQDVLFEAQRNAFIHTVFEQLQFQLGSAEAGLPGFIDSMIVASRDGQPEVVPKRLLNPNSVSALLGQPVLPIAGDEPANCGWTFIQAFGVLIILDADELSWKTGAIILAGRLTSTNRNSIERHRMLVIAPYSTSSNQDHLEKALVHAIEQVLQFGIMYVTCVFVDVKLSDGVVQPCFELAHQNLQAKIVPNSDILVLAATRPWIMSCIGSVPMTLPLPSACGIKASVHMQIIPQVLPQIPIANSGVAQSSQGSKGKAHRHTTPSSANLDQWREYVLPSGLQAAKLLHAIPISSIDLSIFVGFALIVRPAEVADDLRSWRLNKLLFGSLCENLHSSAFALLLQTSQGGANLKEHWLLLPPKVASTHELLLVKVASREQALIVTETPTEPYTADRDEQEMVENFMRESIASLEALAWYNPLDFPRFTTTIGLPNRQSGTHSDQQRQFHINHTNTHSGEKSGLQFRSV